MLIEIMNVTDEDVNYITIEDIIYLKVPEGYNVHADQSDNQVIQFAFLKDEVDI